MQDTFFYGGAILASIVLSQVPEITAYKELTATVILGALFGWTLTRLYPAFTKLTQSIDALKDTIENRIQKRD